MRGGGRKSEQMRAFIGQHQTELLVVVVNYVREVCRGGGKKDPTNQKAYKAERKCKVFPALDHLM